MRVNSLIDAPKVPSGLHPSIEENI